ncbi:MAG: hypothetical protein IJC78_01975 [Clostridia bacterium]|nr:hypothetical protein [Clostridia bacterium]
MSNTFDVVQRHEKVAFFGVAGEGDTVTYHRMRGFTEMSNSKNPVEYSRRYVDEAFERTDVTGYSPSLSYKFDEIQGDSVHADLIAIEDNEMIGSSAIRDIVIVDMTKEVADKAGTYTARKRSFTVIPDSSGDSTDAMTHSGTFRANGESVVGTCETSDGWQTMTFTAASE